MTVRDLRILLDKKEINNTLHEDMPVVIKQDKNYNPEIDGEYRHLTVAKTDFLFKNEALESFNEDKEGGFKKIEGCLILE